jgi:hypothetical protein
MSVIVGSLPDVLLTIYSAESHTLEEALENKASEDECILMTLVPPSADEQRRNPVVVMPRAWTRHADRDAVRLATAAGRHPLRGASSGVRR